MASFARALRPLARQVMVATATRATPRTLMMIAAVHSKRVAVAFPAIQTRGVKTISFAGVPETVYGKYLIFLELGGSLISNKFARAL